MRRWLLAIATAEIVLNLGGWGLVTASRHGGNRHGGSPFVWHVGGVVVYASVVLLPVAVLLMAGLVVAHYAARPPKARVTGRVAESPNAR